MVCLVGVLFCCLTCVVSGFRCVYCGELLLACLCLLWVFDCVCLFVVLLLLVSLISLIVLCIAL